MTNIVNLPTYEQVETFGGVLRNVGDTLDRTSGVLLDVDGNKYRAIAEGGYRLAERVSDANLAYAILTELENHFITFSGQQLNFYDKNDFSLLASFTSAYNTTYYSHAAMQQQAPTISEDDRYIYVLQTNAQSNWRHLDVFDKATLTRIYTPSGGRAFTSTDKSGQHFIIVDSINKRVHIFVAGSTTAFPSYDLNEVLKPSGDIPLKEYISTIHSYGGTNRHTFVNGVFNPRNSDYFFLLMSTSSGNYQHMMKVRKNDLQVVAESSPLYIANKNTHSNIKQLDENTLLVISSNPSNAKTFIFNMDTMAILMETAVPDGSVIFEIIGDDIHYLFARDGTSHHPLYEGLLKPSDKVLWDKSYQVEHWDADKTKVLPTRIVKSDNGTLHFGSSLGVFKSEEIKQIVGYKEVTS